MWGLGEEGKGEEGEVAARWWPGRGIWQQSWGPQVPTKEARLLLLAGVVVGDGT